MNEKVSMIINKHFSIKINSEYQSYAFGSSMSLTLPKEIDPTNKKDKEYIDRCNTWLSTRVIEDTINDVKAFAGDNDKFRVVLASRNRDIEMLPQKFSELNVAKTSNMEV